jgi:alginate O-acetyltransferase complex protein AlgI
LTFLSKISEETNEYFLFIFLIFFSVFFVKTLLKHRFQAWLLAFVNCSFYLALAKNTDSLIWGLSFLIFVVLAYPLCIGILKERFTSVKFVYPVLLIILYNFVVPSTVSGVFTTDYFSAQKSTILILGVSYISFRMLLFLADHQKIKNYSFFSYLAYVLYWPTCFVGPITCPIKFHDSLMSKENRIRFNESSVGRILVGLLKIFLFSTLASRASFDSILFDGNVHSPSVIVISAYSYYLFLYFNFSGACDLAIGISNVFGIHTSENFNAPFRACNISDYWRRWHMTLTGMLRRFIATPIMVIGARRLSRKMQPLVTCFALFFTFVFVAIWHGVGLNYLLFGLFHGFAMSAWFLWSRSKKSLVGLVSPKLFDSVAYSIICWLMTHTYVAGSMVLFANNMERLKKMTVLVGW